MNLFINTAEKNTYIALFDGKAKIIASKEQEGQFSQSEFLLKEINNLLASPNMELSGLKNILVNLGPGSYTGIRVGVATANSLAFGLNIPIIGIKNDDTKDLENNIFSNSSICFSTPVSPIYLKEPFITKAKHGPQS